jgi:DNA modification methylase
MQPSRYHRLSLAEKQTLHRECMREPAVVCPICETQTTAADLLEHIETRCPGPRDPNPLSVMRELVRVVVPGGLVLDPFAGAGTTGLAALAEGRRFIGIDMHHAYAAIARRRLAAAV